MALSSGTLRNDGRSSWSAYVDKSRRVTPALAAVLGATEENPKILLKPRLNSLDLNT